MGDHRVGAVGVTSHDDGVVDRRPGVGGFCRRSQMSSLVHKGGGGWVKRKAEAVCGADEDADGDVGAARGAGVGDGAVCGAGVDVGAAHGVAIVSEVGGSVKALSPVTGWKGSLE
jgi:hypothetical protein